jgi:chromosome partitioning protein
MPRIITISNQKGGVGKTTITREIGVYLSLQGRKTLLIDSDPQGNLTKGLTEQRNGGLYDAYCDEAFLLVASSDTLSILAGTSKLALIEKMLLGEIDGYMRLKDILTQDIFRTFEYILIDTPPSLGALTINALVASDYLLIVINPALYTMQGTNDLLEAFAKVKKTLNPSLQRLGTVVNKCDKHPVIVREILAELATNFKDELFHTYLSKSIKIEEAIAQMKGTIECGNSKVKDEIEAIGKEFVERIYFK